MLDKGIIFLGITLHKKVKIYNLPPYLVRKRF